MEINPEFLPFILPDWDRMKVKGNLSEPIG
jgi:hypothetical protein